MDREINGYRLLTKFTTAGSGSARWCFAEKGGRQYFLKEFLSPVFPGADVAWSDGERQAKEAMCRAFEARKRTLYGALRASENGNIILVDDFFLSGTKYYAATERVPESSMRAEDVHLLSADNVLVILKALVHCLTNLSRMGLVHADLKPTNVLIKETVRGFYTVKLIDFDNSFFENDPPTDSSEIGADTVYMAPEVFLNIVEEHCPMTCKVDVFSLGIMFHQFLTGELPHFDVAQYDYLYEAVLSGAEIALDDVPPKLRALILRMLSKSPDDRPGYREISGILDEVSTMRKEAPERMPGRPPQNRFLHRATGL